MLPDYLLTIPLLRLSTTPHCPGQIDGYNHLTSGSLTWIYGRQVSGGIQTVGISDLALQWFQWVVFTLNELRKFHRTSITCKFCVSLFLLQNQCIPDSVWIFKELGCGSHWLFYSYQQEAMSDCICSSQ